MAARAPISIIPSCGDMSVKACLCWSCVKPMAGAGSAIRASFGIYNTAQDIDRLIAGVRAVQRQLGART